MRVVPFANSNSWFKDSLGEMGPIIEYLDANGLFTGNTKIFRKLFAHRLKLLKRQ